MSNVNPDALIAVAAVCGTKVTVYDALSNGEQRRSKLFEREFTSHGAAKMFAAEFEDGERQSLAARGGRRS